MMTAFTFLSDILFKNTAVQSAALSQYKLGTLDTSEN